MRNDRARTDRVRTVARVVTGVLAGATLCWLPAGAAHADETNTSSHNGPRIGLVNVGQVDDPMEDVLEHTLLFGDGYRWG
ncbi:hypothetical protein OG920_10870 [Streptomyces europaeiscabiei]|uniref:hypothetical protein n=1 Tax=Streptomyces TaxID=1883 RepID=UPI000A3A2376|nr:MULTISPECIES: hypothetical protein [Streptomyces]MDX3585403.1 hypothetical protein [Streptomyces europaeiscabiei]MDX3613773.1 hypothetical protein [Streptomyces europaeiscabiei]MDX3635267.1 hypothetical protein [Streptomyces europaeiscabiei]MDX3653621.1 hypothetical protein [Streptomyces europaeiscabiei]WUD31880.1 hypothetical protein OG858_10900 [Streptomyces europaeiscabiei]